MHNEPVSSVVRDLMRQAAKSILMSEAPLRDQLQDAVIETFDTRNDPAAETAIRRYNMLSVTHWASAIFKDPEASVEPYVDPAIRLQIREQLRQGTPETILNGYRAAQIIAWRAWMQLAFRLTDSKTDLELLLEFSSKQINTFSEQCVELLSEMIEEERVDYAKQSPDRQQEAARAILAGTMPDPQKAMQALGYRLDRTHQALIVWSREPEINANDLEVLVDRILLAAHGAHALRIKAKASVAWLWLSDPVAVEDLSAISDENFEIATGQVLSGLTGFKESHRTALITQQMMLKTKRIESVVSYDQIKLAHLLLQQADFTDVATATLGELCNAPDGIRESLRVYLAEGANAARAANALGLHRNTLNRHLERANDLLPEPLHAGNRLQIGAVLDALSWS